MTDHTRIHQSTAQLAWAILACFAMAAAAGLAGADTFTVDTNADVGPGSLRNAIAAANANPGPDTIEVGPVGTISPFVPLPALSDPSGGTAIVAEAGVVIDGAGGQPFPTGGTGEISGVAPAVGPTAGGNGLVIQGAFSIAAPLSSISMAMATYAIYFGDNTDAARRAQFDDSESDTFFTESEIFILAPPAPDLASDTVTVALYHIEADESLTQLGSGPYTYIDESGLLTNGLTLASAGNAVAGLSVANFPGSGILITGAAAMGNTVQRSTIGNILTKSNGGSGIVIADGASGNSIGGIDAADGNLLSGNGGDGVLVAGAGTAANSILSNSISANTGVGIRLEDGANAGIAAPVLTGASPVSGTAPVSATVQVFFGSDEEGETLLGTTTADGSGAFSLEGDISHLGGMNLTATATDAAGNTSEFSAVFLVSLTPPVLTLNGAANFVLECGVDSFIDPGATAQDATDGDLTTQIETSITFDGIPVAVVDLGLTGTYVITYSVTNSAEFEATAERTIEVLDRNAPGIRLNGESSVVVEPGSVYTDAGATATDVCDGQISVTVDASGVDTAVSGVYHVEFIATDSAGNQATAHRTVIVDAGPPDVTLLGDNPLIVPCEGTFSDPGATALDDLDGDLTDQIVVTGVVNLEVPGQYTLTYTATDSLGNTGSVDRTVIVLACPLPCEEECANEVDPVDADGDGITACYEACYGTSDALIDTDGDGMPDPYEIAEGLDPTTNDADGDLDGNHITNLDEYLRGSKAGDASSPGRLVFVGLNGADAPGRGSESAPFATVDFAMASGPAPTTAHPLRIVLLPGSYQQDVELRPWVTLAGVLDGGAMIRGVVVGANNSAIENLTLGNAQPGNVAILFLNNAAMRISNVTFTGLNAQATGILVRGVGSSAAVVEDCWFSNLSIGMDIENAVPIIRRNVFDAPATASIVIRESVADGNPIGSLSDSRTGWNTFHIAPNGFGVINLTTRVVEMPVNDWASQDVNFLNAKIIGPVNFVPFLMPNTARLASTLYVTLWDAKTQAPIANGSVSVDNANLVPVERNQGGIYRFHSLAARGYEVVAEAEGYDFQTTDIGLVAGERVSIFFALERTGSGSKRFPGCAAGQGEAPAPRAGEILLLAGLLAGLYLASRLRTRGQAD